MQILCASSTDLIIVDLEFSLNLLNNATSVHRKIIKPLTITANRQVILHLFAYTAPDHCFLFLLSLSRKFVIFSFLIPKSLNK